MLFGPTSLLLLAFAVVCRCEGIDDIIDRHWRRYESDVLAKRVALPSEPVFTSPVNLSYHCVHDDISQALGIREARRRGYLMATADSRRLRDARSDAQDAAGMPSVVAAGFAVKASPTDRASFKPIRIYPDTSRLSSDPRTCFSGVQAVKIGSQVTTNSPTCSYDGQTNCWHRCRSVDTVDSSLQTLLSQYVIPAMTDEFASFLRVSPVSGNLKLSRQAYSALDSCGDDIPISRSLVDGQGPGTPNADVYVFVTARPADSDSTVAYATSCNWVWDSSSNTWGRTLAGQINFSPLHFRGIATSSFQFRSVIRAAIHEMTHTLGFSSSLYADYRNNDGVPYAQPVTRSRVDTYNGGTKTTQTMVSPRVAQFAREHFDCPSHNGVELEDAGSSGTAGSHWERRTAGPEYMTGYINPQMPITALTMALLEDTGFYSTDYTQAEPLQWGRGLGCGFATGRCETTWNTPGYFCSTTGGFPTCSPEGDSFGTCNFQTNLQVPPFFQHFAGRPTWGGRLASADYCPFTAPSTYCKDSSVTPAYGGTAGPTSTCFSLNAGKNAGCFAYNCAGPNSLEVVIDGKTMQCPPEGGTLPAIGTSLVCPPAAQLCDPDAYLSAWPRVTSVSPTSGSSTDSISLTIGGANFVPGRAYRLWLGSAAASSVTAVSNVSITASVSAQGCDGGIVDVKVLDSTTQNSGVLFAGFSYTDCLSDGAVASFSLTALIATSMAVLALTL